jgi:hypothetical protein
MTGNPTKLAAGLAAALALGACAAEPADDDNDNAGGGAFVPPPASMAGTGGSAGATTPPPAGGAGSVSLPPITGGAGMAGMAGAAGAAGVGGMAGMAGAAGVGGVAGAAGAAGMAGAAGTAGGAGMMGAGMCCADGNCLCHGPDPTGLTSDDGPYNTDSYSISGVGCVYYPTDAEPPFAAVAISDGFLGSGGCGSFQTGAWGPLYASHGIVAMIVVTGSSDQPSARGNALAEGIAAFKAENMDASSPLSGKLSGRYGTSGFSMGGGGTTYAAQDDPTLLTNVAIMPWGPVDSGITVPTLVICGQSDGTASCSTHGTPAYNGIADSVPKMRVVVSGGHNGQPSAGGGESGEFGLAFQKVFLEGDERWRPHLVGGGAEDTNIQ